MGMPKGKTGNPNGRPKGSKNRATSVRAKTLVTILNKYKSPLEFLLGVMTTDSVDLDTRMDAAKAAAPYVHRRMPIAIENAGEAPFRIFDMAKLNGLSEGELMVMRDLIAKAALVDEGKKG